MAFQNTEWKYSGEVDGSMIAVEEGPQFLSIIDAVYREEEEEYTLTVKSLSNEAEFALRYWLSARDAEGAITPNSKARGTLISLGIALAGEPIGIPNPVDVKGGVVQAKVVMSKPNAKGAQYPRVYSFGAVPEDIYLAFGNIEQFYIPSEE